MLKKFNEFMKGEEKKPASHAEKKEGKKPARVLVKYNVGFGNTLSIRGKGAGLSWEKGKALKNVSADEWVWETEEPCEFKVLINDKVYEAGENHRISAGSVVKYTPHF